MSLKSLGKLAQCCQLCSRNISFASIWQKRAPKKIRRLLVANRGEIAVRILKTAHRMGIETAAVFSDADRNSMHRSFADDSFYIGPSPSIHSYRNYERILDAAKKFDAQAVHPGYGFLSENATFADMCASRDLKFIGPPSSVIRMVTSKATAKQLIAEAGVPVTDGYHGKEQTCARLRHEAFEIGLPVILKANCGAGGRGMRVVWKDYEFVEKLEEARLEALQLFGNKEMIIEKYIVDPRHIEVQIFGDSHGNYVHLWDRDCTIQRRHQKIIEEAPAFNLLNEIRRKLTESALCAARAVQYVGAGTVEYILDKSGAFYFNEMNARLQVEHPVTEELTGIDLVEWQIRVAQGEKLPKTQEEIESHGHAIEARIYAEDTENRFVPETGRLKYVYFPTTVRIDTGIREGDDISPYYDPLIAKITALGEDRQQAIEKLDEALQCTRIAGPPTNLSLIQSVLKHKDYMEGNVSTEFINKHEKVLRRMPELTELNVCEYAVARLLLAGRGEASQASDDFIREEVEEKVDVTLGHRSYLVEILDDTNWLVNTDSGKVPVALTKCRKDGHHFVLFEADIGGQPVVRTAIKVDDRILIFGEGGQRTYRMQDSIPYKNGRTGVTDAYAPTNGVVEKIYVKEGDLVQLGDPILEMVSMKMEYVIRSPLDAIVQSILCSVGEKVQENEQLVTFVNRAAGLQGTHKNGF